VATIRDEELVWYMWILSLYYSQLHVESHSIKSSHLNLIGLFSTEHDKRDVENSIID